MFINSISNQNFKAKVPLSEYKGVILKLTKKDNEKIAKLIEQRTLLEFELSFINKMLEKKKTIIGSSTMFNRKIKLEAFINDITNQIKEIKINRLNKQKARAEKKVDLMV